MNKALPGPRGLPVIGSLHVLGRNPHLDFHRLAEQWGDIFALRMGSVQTVVLSNPALIEEAFAKPELNDRFNGMIMLTIFRGTDMGTAPYGDHWKKLARIANQNIVGRRQIDRLRGTHMAASIDRLVEEVARTAASGATISPVHLLSLTDARLVFRCVFGDIDVADEEYEDFLTFLRFFFRHGTTPFPADYLPWLRFVPSRLRSEAERQAVIRDRILARLIDRVRRRPGLDLAHPTCMMEELIACEEKERLSEETISLFATDIMITGSDTSGQTIAWLLLLLANRPALQERLHDEIDRAIAKGEIPRMEDHPRLPLLDATVRECMRFRTTVPLGAPHFSSAESVVGGYRIPAKAQVISNLYTVHHSTRYWQSPHEFLPERFLNLSDNPGAFMPFGAGRRACPGRRFAEVVMWLQAARLLHRFRFVLPRGRRDPIAEDEVFGLTVTPRAFELAVEERRF